MIPNISVDAAVQRHIEELAEWHIDGWEAGGPKILAWSERKEYNRFLLSPKHRIY
jgi:hypothetical protein